MGSLAGSSGNGALPNVTLDTNCESHAIEVQQPCSPTATSSGQPRLTGCTGDQHSPACG